MTMPIVPPFGNRLHSFLMERRMKASARALQLWLLSIVLWQSNLAFADQPPLHVLIDQQLAPPGSQPPGLCSDAEFIRRVSLDLTGMPPTADEVRAFLADQAPEKRVQLVDRLLESPHYARQTAWWLDLMLMERRGNTHVTADEWQLWLLNAARQNKPWNVLAKEILSADGDDPAQRPAVRFTLDRGAEPNLLTRDVGRMFFGKDMQCAQCHNNPIVADYLQSDYQGLLAYLAPSYAVARKEGDKQITIYAERAGTDLTFESVFVKGTQHRTGPRLPGGGMLTEPFFFPGEEYTVAPGDGIKSVPKFSRRAQLADLATDGTNDAFNRNMANRLWARMLGRGLVEPVDMHHAGNPPTHPALLQLLTEQFVAMNFDMKRFVREIALTAAYQRPFDAPADLIPLATQAAAELAQLEQQRATLEAAVATTAEEYAKAAEAWRQASAAAFPVAGEIDAARNQFAEAKKKVDEAAKAVADAQTAQQAKQNVANAVSQAATAAQAAAQALPEDKELAEATQKFVSRTEQLTAEVAALAKTVEEKQAALQEPTNAMNALRPNVDAALARHKPLLDAQLQAESLMLAARVQATQAEQALDALAQRVETVRRLAQLPELQQAILAARQAVGAREGELATAQTQLTEYAAVVAQSEQTMKTAGEALAAAANAVAAAKAAQAKQAEAGNAIATALASAEGARRQVPEDAVLGDVVAKLTERNAAAQAQTAEAQKGLDAALAAEKQANDALAAAKQAHEQVAAERTRREQQVASADAAVAAAKNQVAESETAFNSSVLELTDRFAKDFTLAALKPLTPEQLCWSVFQVTGVYGRYWLSEIAELDKSAPLTEEQKQDPAALAARNADIEQRVYDKLKGNIGIFVAFYGAAPGQPQGDFFATADQALFTANQGAINGWIAPAGGNVTERVVNQSDPKIAAEELYLGILSKMPTDEESAFVTQYLANRAADRNVAAQELAWGLLNSAEFRFNH